MVIHTCTICKREFNKKSHYIFHITKKKIPCIQTDININKENNILHQQQKFCTEIAPITIKNKKDDNDDNYINNINIEHHKDNKKEHSCIICKKAFTRESSLKRHLLSRCKTINNKINIECDKNNDNNDNNILKIVSELKEENNELKKTIMELAINAKASNTNNGIIKTDNSTNNTNTNNINNQVNGNITTNNIKIEFGKEDLDKISNDFFIKTLVNYSGAAIPSKIIEGIHFNPEFKEFMNVFISDISRNKAMVFDGKTWNVITEDIVKKYLNNTYYVYGLEQTK